MKKYKRILYCIGMVVVLMILAVVLKQNLGTKTEDTSGKKNIEQEEKPQEKISNDDLKESDLETEERTITVCIDPGHYRGVNQFTFNDSSSYCEGDTTLLIASKLRDILKKDYGIEAYLTRESGDITIQEFTNAELDKGHISLRGEAADGSDFFISIHTNANNERANGYDTLEQPIGINKPILLLNSVARENQDALNTANLIGKNIAEVLYNKGVSTVQNFQTKTSEQMNEWTDDYNDSIDVPGTLCYRLYNGEDYYGVLRGATNVGVPGVIVEHAFHTVPEVRDAFLNEEFITALAQADADAIAAGFGISKKLNK